MPKHITKQDFLSLVTKKDYKSEQDLEIEVFNKLPALLKVKSSQITHQFITTGFDRDLSNCADIVIRSDEEVPHILLVIELKLDRNVEKYHQGNYTLASKQLRKYCQDVRALYGVLLTDHYCFFYHYYYHRLGSNPERINNLPYPDVIDRELGHWSIIDAMIHHTNDNYFVFTITVTLLAIVYAAVLTILRLTNH